VVIVLDRSILTRSTLSSTTMPNLSSQQASNRNTQTYQQLKLALSLHLRRQLFMAVCDNINLRNQLAVQLHTELSQEAPRTMHLEDYPGTMHPAPRELVSLMLDLNDPNPVGQVAAWLHQHRQTAPQEVLLGGQGMLGFQILGVEQLTRQPATVQRLFLSYLRTIERNLPRLNCSLLIWVNRPWGYMIRQSAPECWNWCTGVFEFVGDPVPLLSPLFAPKPLEEVTEIEVAVAAHASRDQGSPHQEKITVNPVEPPVTPESGSAGQSGNYGDLLDILSEDLAELDQQDQQPLDHDSQASTLQAQTAAREETGGEQSAKDFLPGSTLHPAALLDQVADSPHNGISPLEGLKARIERLRSENAPLSILAGAYLNLGRYYRNRIEQGDLAQDILRGGIEAYEQVLEWLCFSEVSPEEIGDVAWSDILNDLGTLYWMASRSPNALDSPTETLHEHSTAYLQQAVQAYLLGLKKISETDKPRSYAMLQNNLGTVYSDLAHYTDTLNNLQKAIVAYKAALNHRRPDTDPLKFAATQNNLGTAYWHLAQHNNPVENLQQAITAYNQALRYYRPDQEPVSYAMIQNNLGTAYWNLSQYVSKSGKTIPGSEQVQSKDWLQLAIHAYQCALRFRTLEASPTGYAATQNNLGTAYWHLAHQCKDNPQTLRDYLQLSIKSYEAALQAAEQMNYRDQATVLSFDLFATHNNLGLAHYQVATDPIPQGDQPSSENHLAAALHHHLQALLGWKQQPDFYQTAMTYVVQTIRQFYEQWGTSGQNRALAQVPGHLLPEVLGKL
jgi:tetratricopeptide (TPR) repeat protein